MKILHLSGAKNWGGGENHIENLCLELKKTNEEIENLILCVRNGSFHEKLKDIDLIVETAPLLTKIDLRYVFKILKICRQHKIDLIHIHDSTALTLAVMASTLNDLPPFILSKKTSFPIKPRKRTIYKYNHPKIKKILCVSEETKRITSEKIKDWTKLSTLYHGTTLDKPIAKDLDLRKELNIPDSNIIVGTIANHIRAKNLDTWVEMINEVVNNRQIKNFHFIQIGSYTNRSEVYFNKIKNLGLSDFVSFTGFIPHASRLIPHFDISLLTSQSEGIPQFIYESFYYKIPVLSTNVGGIPEIIKDGENALLTNPHEPQSLADKLIALSRDKVLMKKFTDKSYDLLLENFTTTKMAEQTLAEYKKVLYGKY